MKRILPVAILISALSWALTLYFQPLPQVNVWIIRDQFILFTGLSAFVLMSLIMLLAVRPMWLERRMGGLDKMYRLHKWTGITATVLATLHYLAKLSKPLLLAGFDPAVKIPRTEAMLDVFRGSAKDLGEWAVWVLVAVVVLTLWRRFPYHIWRYVHKVSAVIYVVVAFHGLVLTPVEWWLQPAGWLVAAAAAVGTVCALLAFTGRIGASRRHSAEVVDVQPLSADILSVTCRVKGEWSHRPGQFAFLTCDRREGAHPFTVSAADRGAGEVRFSIKALGDYTRRLQNSLRPGQTVMIEGPYGCFDLESDQTQTQIWIAAGIGVTPFISWLEFLQENPTRAPQATLYYCVRNASEDVFAQQLRNLCLRLPSITLNVHYTEAQRALRASDLLANHKPGAPWPSIWFCGPTGFADALKDGLHRMGMPVREHFHQEAFQLR